MSKQWHIPRRTFLRGVGTAVALPLLDAMVPTVARGAVAAPEAPRRMAFLYVPNGIHMPDWTPGKSGREFDLRPILAPLAEVRDDLLVISGLAHDKARANGDGAGDHARSVATFLTGSQARKTSGKDIRVGVSVDQIAAQQVGDQTQFPSLELGCERGRMAGSCDSGYSCAYSSNISWRTESTPVAKEINPRAVFDRLFAGDHADETAEARGKRQRYRQSVLDYVGEEAARLQKRLGRTDRRKLEEYLTSVRELEQQIERAAVAHDEQPQPDLSRPTGVPKQYAAHVRVMGDLLALAFQADLTRIATFMLANAGSNRSYASIGVPEGHHSLSHHGGAGEKQRKISKINRFHVEQFAYLLKKLRSIREGEGTLLDNSMIVYGSGIGDGNRHNHDDLPVLLAGRGGGTIETGRHLRLPRKTPLMNLYLSMLTRMGVEIEEVGDSTGRMEQLKS